MNHKIKFRAWDTDSVAYVEAGFDVRIDGEGYVYRRIWGESIWGRCSNLEIEFYTDKTDKNGKEIYAADILRDTTDDIGLVYWNENVAGFYCKWGDGSDMPLNTGVATDKCELISNIHENPELMEQLQ